MAQQLSNQITVATAGTAVRATSTDRTALHGTNHFVFKALAANGGNIYIGNDGAGDVTSANGIELDAGESVEMVVDLDDVWFDTSNNGDKVAYAVKKLGY